MTKNEKLNEIEQLVYDDRNGTAILELIKLIREIIKEP